jgi:hypothetical protein
MKKPLIITSLILLAVTTVAISTPVLAECPEGSVPTAILGDVKGTNGENCIAGTDDGTAIGHIIKLVLQFMTIGIGILGVLGIVLVGIQYITAGGSEEKTRKAKRRMFEIAVGLATYALIFAGLNFLIPDASFDADDIKWEPSTSTSQPTSSGGSSTTNTPSGSSSSSSSSNSSNSGRISNNLNPATAGAIANGAKARAVAELQKTVAEYTYSSYSTMRSKTSNTYDNRYKKPERLPAKKDYSLFKGKGSYECPVDDCGVYVKSMVRASGWDSGYNKDGFGNFGDNKNYKGKGNFQYMQNSDKWQDITSQAKSSVTDSKPNGILEPGDVITSGPEGGNHHIMLFVGKIPGFQYQVTEASHCNFPGTSAQPAHRNLKSILKTYGEGPVRVYRRVF